MTILLKEYIFGDGKIDEYLKDSTNQTHYPYIYINKEFVGDHRTVAYMDYQGTLINTVGLVFLGKNIFILRKHYHFYIYSPLTITFS